MSPVTVPVAQSPAGSQDLADVTVWFAPSADSVTDGSLSQIQCEPLAGSEDAEDFPAFTPLPDPLGGDSVMIALAGPAVLLLVPGQVCGVDLPDVVADPPPGQVVNRMLAA